MTSSIQFDQVSKKYRIGRKLPSLREALWGWKNISAKDFHWAVKNVSFDLQPGDALAVIGPNGAGKTTILKLLSKVTHPSDGQIKVNGRMSALIELGAGFHPDLTGRENVYLNGAILGMSKAEIKSRFDKIVDFAGIEQYLDTPVKRYSSGMYARLGFAIAAHVDPEVLLVDEVLAVGDYAFQQKCYARMDELRTKGTSLILVAHNMEAIRRVCNRGLVMYRGENIFQGTAAEAVVAYSEAVRRAARESKSNVPTENGLSERVMTFDAEIMKVGLLDARDQAITVLKSGIPASAVVDVRFQKPVQNPIFSLTIRTTEGYMIYDTTTHWQNVQTPSFAAGELCRVKFDFRTMNLLEGEYEIGVDIAASNLSHYYDRLERAMSFWVTSSDEAKGMVDLKANIDIQRMSEVEQIYEPASR